MNEKHEEARDLLAKATYMTIFASDWTTSLALEAVEAVKKTPLYRHMVKHWCKELDKERKRYQNMMAKITGEVKETGEVEETYLNLCQDFEDDMREQRDELIAAVTEAFEGFKYAEVYAKIEMVRVMAKMSCQINEELSRAVLKATRGRIDLGYMRQTDISNKAYQLAMAAMEHINVNLNDSPRVRSALEQVERKLFEGEVVKRASEIK